MKENYLPRFPKACLSVIILLLIGACHDQEVDEFDPIAVNQQFSIMENSPNNTPVGTVAAKKTDLNFSILDGDPDHAFTIEESTGIITIADSSKVDFEETAVYTLTIQAKQGDNTSSKPVTVKVLDMTPTTISLVSHYKFQDNLNDDELVNNGSIYGGVVSYEDKNGKNNKAISLDGSTNVLIPKLFDYEYRTVSLWVKVVGDNSAQLIYVCDNADVQYGNTILGAYIQDSKMNLLFNVSGAIDYHPIEYNTWYHAAFVVDGKKFTVFFNGEKFEGQTFTDYINSTTSALSGTVLGSSRVGSDRFFTGDVDDLRIYNRALSERELELLYYEEPK